MNTLYKIHYAVEIVTDSTITDAEIELNNGVFRFVTDGYSPAPTDTFEDGTPVVDEYFSGLLLKKDGVRFSTQSIDIVSGGDFAFLSSLAVTLSNHNSIHEKLTTTEGLYLCGSSVRFFVIINGVWFQRFRRLRIRIRI